MIDTLAEALIGAIQRLSSQGLTPATSSNFSARRQDGSLWITVSGRDKTQISTDDLMLLDREGRSLDPALRPSAETALHLQIYRQFPSTRAVLHTHSRHQTVASRLFAPAGGLKLEDYELLKALAGLSTHATALWLPVVTNSQDMADIQAAISQHWQRGDGHHGYLIEGHGLYAWGDSVADALRHIEALEFLLACELDLRRH